MAPADKPQALRQIKLPYAPGEQRPEDVVVVTNGTFDQKTLVLSEFNKARGIGDCGEWNEWAWDGQAFRLLRSRSMGRCSGLLIEEWPVMYQAVVR